MERSLKASAARTHSNAKNGSNTEPCKKITVYWKLLGSVNWDYRKVRTSSCVHDLDSFSASFLLALEVSRFSIYRCSSWFKTRITDRQHPNEDNRMHHGGAITAIQYPEHKVLPNLTQGQKHIWTHKLGHKLWGAGFIPIPAAPVQPVLF